MNILCCYTLNNPYGRHVNLQPAVATLLEELDARVENLVWSYQVDNDEEGYWKRLWERWDYGSTFINMEHDVLPTHEQLRELWDCPEPWCAHEYPMGDGENYGAGIGCTKFGEDLIFQVPECIEEVGRIWPGMRNALHAPKNWSQLDGRIYTVIRNRTGRTGPHIHGRVEHLNPYHHGAEYPRDNASPGAPKYRSRTSG